MSKSDCLPAVEVNFTHIAIVTATLGLGKNFLPLKDTLPLENIPAKPQAPGNCDISTLFIIPLLVLLEVSNTFIPECRSKGICRAISAATGGPTCP